jgi:hypothetical protein
MFYSLKLFTNKLFSFALKKGWNRVRKNSAFLRDGSFKLFRIPEINSKESIPPAYVAIAAELEFLKSLWGLGTE